MGKLTEKMNFFSARTKKISSRIFAEFDRRRGAVLLIYNTLLVEKPFIIFQMLHEKYSKFGDIFFWNGIDFEKIALKFWVYRAQFEKPLSKNPCL